MGLVMGMGMGKADGRGECEVVIRSNFIRSTFHPVAPLSGGEVGGWQRGVGPMDGSRCKEHVKKKKSCLSSALPSGAVGDLYLSTNV
jgi:hypothetical protein